MTGNENDFDLSDVIKIAIGQLKNSPHSRLNRPRSTSAKMPKYKHPCGICQKSVNKNQKAICCSLCSNWGHRKCNGTSLKEYDLLVAEDDSTFWQCNLCDIEDLTAKFPFGLLTKMELYDLYGVDLPSEVKLLPSYELHSKRSQIPSLDYFDIDENYVQTISSNYFDITDFSNTFSSLKKHFSLFHVNTRSLPENFDQLCTMLSTLGVSFDLLGISETKQQTGKNFISNVDIEGYHIYTQPSKSAARGVAIYVKDKLDHFK